MLDCRPLETRNVGLFTASPGHSLDELIPQARWHLI
jgi:hypothetical protein